MSAFLKKIFSFTKRVFSLVFKWILFVLSLIVGKIEWQTPLWLKYTAKFFKFLLSFLLKHKKISAAVFAAVVLLSAAGYCIYVWQQNQPEPIDVAPIDYAEVYASVYAPAKTNYSNEHVFFNYLYVHFDRTAAPIENIGANVSIKGARLSPEINGTWEWINEYTLAFKPSEDWRIGETYKVKIDPKILLNEQVRISKNEYEFSTEPFKINITNKELYQNPEKPSEKNTIFEVNFAYPVDAASFEKQISMQLQAPQKYKIPPKPYKFAVKYDDKKMKAWIRSEFVKLPEIDSEMVLNIKKGVKSSIGGAPTSTDTASSQRVSSVYTDVVESIFLTIAEKENNEQEQVLVIKLIDKVNVNDLSKQVKAYILPKDKPSVRGSKLIKNHYWSNNDDIGPEVLALSKPLELKADIAEDEYQNIASFKYKSNPGDYIYVICGQEITTLGGYKPKNRVYNVMNVPQFPQVLKFAGNGVLLSLKGEKKVPIFARNIEGFQLEINRVIPSQIQHLVNFNDKWQFSQSSFGYLDSSYFTQRFTYNKTMPAANSGKVSYEGVDLSEYITNSKGVFLVTLSSWDPKNKIVESHGSGGSRLIVVTDLGIIAKRSTDKSHDVFVQSIKDGQAVEGAKVSVLGRNGVAIASAVTDANGRVHFKPFPDYNKTPDLQLPVVYIVQKDDDLSFLPYDEYANNRQLEFSRFDVGGVQNVAEQGRLSAYIFSDRGLYRPGERVNIGSIVRAEDWDIPVGGIPVIASVYDARGQLFKSTALTIDESGFNELAFTTTADAPTGSWTVYLHVAMDYRDKDKAGIFLGSNSVLIKEFEPDRMKAEIKLTPAKIKGWVKPNELSAVLKAENLFGTPAQNRLVTSSLILSPAAFSFKEYGGYYFYDGYYNSQELFDVSLEDSKTDENGIAQLNLLLEEYAEATYQMAIVAEVFEAGAGRSVTSTASAFISPNDYLIGARADGDLGYIKKNSERKLNFIAINQNLTKIAANDLSIEIWEQRYVSVLTLQDSGVYKYQSKLKEMRLNENAFSIGVKGVDYTLDTKKPGNYKIVVKNSKGGTFYKTYYSVTGDANIDRSLEKNSELDMKLSKAEYKNGEEIEIAINTPYVGSGLITIEKDKVYAAKRFKTTTTSSTQRITVPSDLKGNGYINVQFVRDFNSEDIFMSPLSYGVVPFKISQDKQSAKIEIESTKLVKPNQDVTISVKTDKKQKVIVFAVDEGILQAANYRLNNPLNHFFAKRALSVQSYQILDLILPEFSKFEKLASAAGGGDYSEAKQSANKNLNPFKRKVEDPVVFWSGITEVDGEKSFTYKVPEYFNGKLRVMAVAVSKEQVGVAQTDTTVRDDFVMTPNVPFMAAPGDVFEVTLGVSNNIEDLEEGRAVLADISLETTKHLETVGNKSSKVNLAKGSESFVKFKVKALSNLGGAELKFRAVYKEGDKVYSTARTGTISVRPITPFRTQTIMGRIGGTAESVDKFRDMYDAFALREASAAHSPLVLANGLTSYLDSYPHQCSEQLVSSAISAMIQEEYAEFNRAKTNGVPYDNIASILNSRQNTNGAIGLWQATAYGDMFVSVYAAHYLVDLKERGVTPSSNLLKKLNDYLASLASNNDIESLEGLRLRAYAVYLLTRQGEVTTNLLSTVQKSLQLNYENSWQNDIAALYLAATYKMLKMDKEAELLLKKPWSDLSKAYNDAWWSRNYYDPLVVNAASIYLISKHFPEKIKDIPPQALENMALMIRSGRYTTTSSSMSILALDSYSKGLNTLEGSDKLSIEAKDAKAKTRVIAQMQEILAKGNFNKDDTQIIFNNPSKLPAWYSVVLEGYDTAAPKEALKKGLEVYREYTDESGNKITKTKLGDKITVTIRVRSNSKEGVGNVAIIDLLPGGFEVVQQLAVTQERADEYDDEYYEEGEYDDEYYEEDAYVSPIMAQGSTWSADYSDIREDRVIIYGTAYQDMRTFKYQIKSTNEGVYALPPIFAEAMYDREIQALSADGGTITVLPSE
ncbi:MAG: alpha-2-macroglobulin family protein [Campylobacteraceae bacterium]|nr:alpha-2-macroglobulin family protein [Campylobacteraceae bacterium]